MSGTLINVIIQMIAGVVGGHAVGATLKDYTLGMIGNTIAGAIGGAIGGQFFQEMAPAMAGVASNIDIGAIVGGGVGGAILTFLAGLTKWMLMPPRST